LEEETRLLGEKKDLDGELEEEKKVLVGPANLIL